MKMIDFHEHMILPVEKQLEMLDRYKIEKAVVMPMEFGNFSMRKLLTLVGMNEKPVSYQEKVLKKLYSFNNALRVKIKEDTKRFIFAAWISPTVYYEETPPEFYLKFKFEDAEPIKIVKFIPVFDHVTSNYYRKMIELLSEIPQTIIMIHTGWGSKVIDLVKVIETFPEKNFVLAHMKEDDDMDNEQRKEVLKKNENVYLETSYAPHSKRIWQYVRAGFGDKLLFGSDYRLPEDEQTLRCYIKMVEEADISKEDKEYIFYQNAVDLLNTLE